MLLSYYLENVIYYITYYITYYPIPATLYCMYCRNRHYRSDKGSFTATSEPGIPAAHGLLYYYYVVSIYPTYTVVPLF